MATDDTTIGGWLAASAAMLAAAGIATARLECLVLLGRALSADRAWLLAHPEAAIEPAIYAKLHRQLEARQTHLPLAYITGMVEFYGRDFYVDEHVLVPRPESETIIELLKSLRIHGTMLDIGTGSGALAITAALEVPGLQVAACDIDTDCLCVARKNARTLGADVRFFAADLLDASKETPYDILVANLPYVPDEYTVNQAAHHEPRLALFGGPDGLEPYRRLFDQLRSYTWRPRFLLTESLPTQHDGLEKIAHQAGFACTARDDFLQVFI
jgi:release factor glutamine methyltransferase